MAIPEYSESALQLPAMGSWPGTMHAFEPEVVAALRAAEAARRPLLVRGEPGTGKSQLAHAAAVSAGRAFLSYVVDARTEATDLMWHYDAVARLADAHMAAIPSARITADELRMDHYVRPGPLWWAFDWIGAERQVEGLRSPRKAPDRPPYAWAPERGVVLLIDEIDKAEVELPNGLLEALGNGRFQVPEADTLVRQAPGQPAPLVIITSNDERELPAPFLRRCLVLTLRLPSGHALRGLLISRARLHFTSWASQNPAAVESAADLLLDDRESARRQGLYMPGMAEFLDLIRALVNLGGDPQQHLAALRVFAYQKQPDL